jgi:hypothetical protein
MAKQDGLKEFLNSPLMWAVAAGVIALAWIKTGKLA